MAPATLWEALVGGLSWSGSAIVVLGLIGLGGLATASVAGFHYVRRLVRHRRVARELARVHEAAYRERFGHRGRLA